MAKSKSSTKKPETATPCESGKKTIADRITEAMQSTKRVSQPDDKAPETAPEGTELANKKAPMGARHLFCLLIELMEEHEVVAKAHRESVSKSDEEAVAKTAHAQNHDDVHAVAEALSEALSEAYPDKDDEFSAFTILKDWSIARKYKSDDDGIPAGLADFLNTLNANSVMGEASRRFSNSDNHPDPMGMGDMFSSLFGGEGFVDFMADMAKNDPGFQEYLAEQAFQEYFKTVDEGIDEASAREMFDKMSNTEDDPDNVKTEDEGDDMLDCIFTFLKDGYGKDGYLTTTAKLGDGKLTFKTVVKLD